MAQRNPLSAVSFAYIVADGLCGHDTLGTCGFDKPSEPDPIVAFGV